MASAIVVINAGSSSLKFSVYLESGDDLNLLIRGQLERMLTAPRFVAVDSQGTTVSEQVWESGASLDYATAIQYLHRRLKDTLLGDHQLAAVGHRVTHGGLHYLQPVLIDQQVVARLEQLVPLVPLHQPHSLAAIDAVAQTSPGLPQVACFDTSFHRDRPKVDQLFALPRRFMAEGVRRYGFHGLSYEYIASRLPEFDTQAAEGRTVVAHLGNGVSMCAMRNGHSVATTIGFTAVDGLPMGTRSGSLDPGVLLYLMDHYQMDARGLQELLYKQSGLLGVSEISSDMRDLLASTDPRAVEAVDLFVYRIGRELGSLVAALGGLDGLVFTAGIGEHAAAIRARVCRDAAWLGLELDESRNEAGGPRISRSESRVSAWVIPTNEELMIARHTRRLLSSST
jgi:acetate kinase